MARDVVKGDRPIMTNLQKQPKTPPSLFDYVTKSVTETFRIAFDAGQEAVDRTHDLLSQVTKGAGETIDNVGSNWFVRRLTRFLNLDWLLGATDSVDVAKAQSVVQKLKQKYPHESHSQLAHHIMVEKATQAGGIGLATSFLPGIAIALLAVDLAATTRLQAEMIYQIAAVYGLDLKDPERRGEVLGIFGLGLGGSRLLKAVGLGLLRNVPFAGATIGASTDAAMVYSLGYAACRFYETKLKSPQEVKAKTINDLQKQSQQYLEVAIAQQVIMDRILVHTILVSHPVKSWEELLPQLQAINISPTSLQVIAEDFKSLQPLSELLNQLNRDFAIPLLAQCYRIVEADGGQTPVETEVINAIANKFDLDLNSIKSMVDNPVN
ncbi:EcsC family protein [Synechocystis sp. PCC 7509]|uniref:EcsC family protein n=1 Tax=Synechocystis sp. PCC 7509 TaxID=927677 RepID=UPI0002ACC200|nr:EcsC family protein [Synechocystis sp. PCC 7509]